MKMNIQSYNRLAPDWAAIIADLTSFAQYQIDGLRWRSHFGGVLPEGFDAEAIASQAIFQFLHSQTAAESSSARVSSDSTVSNLHSSLSWHLRGNVLREVTRLHHLKENHLLSSEPDLARVHDDGELVSPIDLLPDTAPAPDGALVEAETDYELTDLTARMHRHLSGANHLQPLLHSMARGNTNPRTLAPALGLTVPAVKNLKKKLRRTLRPLHHRLRTCRSER